MSDRPDALELLEEARRLLQQELAPALKGKQRFQALMIANALGIAGRELAAADDRGKRWAADLESLGVAGEKELVAAIREGRFAGDETLHSMLLRDADARAEMVSPEKKDR